MTAISDADESARPLPGLVLAGGAGRRMMGSGKAFSHLHGRALVQHMLDRLGPQVGPLVVSASADDPRFLRLGVPLVEDAVPGRLGPLSGIAAGLAWAAGLGAADLVVVPVDAPLLPPDFVARLVAARGRVGPAPVLVARSPGGMQPVAGLWPTALAPALVRFLAESDSRAIRAFLDGRDVESVDIPADRATGLDPFRPLNTPEDLATLAAALSGPDGASSPRGQ
ncbi:molybdenum cofactor guanylyltransferase MobA [Segnochrobactraceae bacterium EtOH-i3]